MDMLKYFGVGQLARLMCALCLFPLLAWGEETVAVSGFGMGDSLGQAIIAAKVDAVLNRDGRTVARSEVLSDVLVSDSVQRENTAYLLSTTVTEVGDAFGGGAYARISALVATNFVGYKLKDGRSGVLGDGCGASRQEALVMAMSEAVLASGSKVWAKLKVENDEIVADEAFFDGYGVLTSYQVISQRQEKTSWQVSVDCRFLPGTNEYAVAQGEPSRGEASGPDVVTAIARARQNLLLTSGAEFSVRAGFAHGEGTQFHTICERHGRMGQFSVLSVRDAEKGMSASVKADVMRDVPGYVSERRADWKGLGKGRSFDVAYRNALCDAFVNRYSVVDAKVEYERGREVGRMVNFRTAGNYFGDVVTIQKMDGEACLVEVKPLIGGDLPTISPEHSALVRVKGYGRGKREAVKNALTRAVDFVFGCATDVNVNERSGADGTSSMTMEHSKKGYVDDYSVSSEVEDHGITTVELLARVKNHDGDEVGWGFWTAVLVLVAIIVGLAFCQAVAGLKLTIPVAVVITIALFATGHWGVGIVLILVGIADCYAENR